MTAQRSEGCLSDLKLDRWLAAELTSAEQRSAEAHLQACERCRARHADRVEARRLFATAAPPFATFRRSVAQPAASAPDPDRRSVPSTRARPAPLARWLAAGGALAAAAALALAIGQPWRQTGPADAGDTRTKGGLARLGWVVRRGDRVFVGHADQPLRAGDRVRFTVSAREPVFVAIFGLDDAGAPSLYYPEGDRLSLVEVGREQLLPAAIEFDAVGDEERVLAVFCRNPEPVAGVHDAIARSAAQPVLPDGCTSERFSLAKERP